MDGNRTLGENICDSGGLAHAWTAYKTSKALDGRPNGVEYRLPGVNYTDDQLFFITFGQVSTYPFTSVVLKIRANQGERARLNVDTHLFGQIIRRFGAKC